MRGVARAGLAGLGAVAAVAARDLVQREHTLLRNFPVLGHARYLLESIGPELRQYLVAGDNEERPFTRDQRRWVYASAKSENNYFGFGTDNDLEYTAGYAVINHRTFGRAVPPSHPASAADVALPSAKVLGGPRGRAHAFRPPSVVNVSAMSFGSLSGAAVEALNRGAALAGCLHNTGEGGLSVHHRHGGELVFQLGTAYFGCRDEHGRFDLDRLKDLVAGAPVRALEIKLSQGAKPTLGGVLPAAKVSAEIAATRGVPEGRDCISPSTSENSRCRDGETQSLPSSTSRISAISRVTLQPGSIPPSPGLAPWESLISIARTGPDCTRSTSRGSEKRPSSLRHPK